MFGINLLKFKEEALSLQFLSFCLLILLVEWVRIQVYILSQKLITYVGVKSGDEWHVIIHGLTFEEWSQLVEDSIEDLMSYIARLSSPPIKRWQYARWQIKLISLRIYFCKNDEQQCKST